MYIPFSRPQKHRLKQSWDPPWTPQIQWEREKSLRIFMQMKSLVDSPGPTFHAPIPQVLAVGINGYKWINKYRQISNIIKISTTINNYQQISSTTHDWTEIHLTDLTLPGISPISRSQVADGSPTSAAVPVRWPPAAIPPRHRATAGVSFSPVTGDRLKPEKYTEKTTNMLYKSL